MDFKGLIDKAKDAAAAAADKVNEIAAAATEQTPAVSPAPFAAAEDGAPGAPAQTTDVAVSTQQARSVAAVTAEKLSELKNVGTEKIQELVSSFQQALPALAMAGYELTEFEIELGITPKLIPHFRYAGRTSEDAIRAREMVRENKLGSLILGGLLKAAEVHKQINVVGFSFSHVEIELGLIPAVRLQYKDDDLSAS